MEPAPVTEHAVCSHQRVALLSASIERRSAKGSFYLVEAAVCRDCSATVTRETIVRPPNEWRAAKDPAPMPPNPLYLCVAAPEPKALALNGR